MKKLLVVCLLGIVAECVAQKLPVLYVDFPGKFHRDMEYVAGRMKLVDTDGSAIELPAQFKTRGATAQQYISKPSFNMKLREVDGTEIDSALLNIRSCSSWILDAMAIDRINMRNRTVFDIWTAFSPLPYNTDFGSRNATKGRFVEVYINQNYTGIYCLTDRINRKLLELKKPQLNEDGSVTIRGVQFKHGTNSYGDQNTPGFFVDSTVCVVKYHDAWELSEPEDYPGRAAWQPLLDFYDNIGNYDYIKEHFYIENIVDYTLLVMAMSIADNWGNKNQIFSIRNVQADGNKARFIISPWDLDTSLGGSWNGSYYNGNYSNWAVRDIEKSAVGLFSTCFRQPEFKQMLKDRWIELREGALAYDSVANRLYDYTRLFVESGAWQRQNEWCNSQKYKPCNLVDDLYAEVNMVAEWYQNRHQEMDSYFGIEPTSVSSADASEAAPDYYDLGGIPASKITQGIIIGTDGSKILR